MHALTYDIFNIGLSKNYMYPHFLGFNIGSYQDYMNPHFLAFKTPRVNQNSQIPPGNRGPILQKNLGSLILGYILKERKKFINLMEQSFKELNIFLSCVL